MSDQPNVVDDWDREDERWQAGGRPLSRLEAESLLSSERAVGPWRVVGAQAALGIAIAAAFGGFGSEAAAWSALYGAAVVVLPAALMARGMQRLRRMQVAPAGLSPAASFLGVMTWVAVKMAASVAMLALAARVVRPIDWPALLASLAACMGMYWLALLWRPGSKKEPVLVDRAERVNTASRT